MGSEYWRGKFPLPGPIGLVVDSLMSALLVSIESLRQSVFVSGVFAAL